jgi:hypothetical protein
MTANEFRVLVLRFRDTSEGAHMGHADFRVGGRIFATLQIDPGWAMVKLTPAQQAEFLGRYPGVFVPASGAWGRQGSTLMRLAAVDEEVVGEALTLAWRARQLASSAPRPRAAHRRSGRGAAPKG